MQRAGGQRLLDAPGLPVCCDLLFRPPGFCGNGKRMDRRLSAGPPRRLLLPQRGSGRRRNGNSWNGAAGFWRAGGGGTPDSPDRLAGPAGNPNGQRGLQLGLRRPAGHRARLR